MKMNAKLLKITEQDLQATRFLCENGFYHQILTASLSEQCHSAEILGASDRKLELECKRKEKLETVKKGLMNELLTGRKRIRIEEI